MAELTYIFNVYLAIYFDYIELSKPEENPFDLF